MAPPSRVSQPILRAPRKIDQPAEFECPQSRALEALCGAVVPFWGPEGILARDMARLRQCCRHLDRAVRRALPLFVHQRRWPWQPTPMASLPESARLLACASQTGVRSPRGACSSPRSIASPRSPISPRSAISPTSCCSAASPRSATSAGDWDTDGAALLPALAVAHEHEEQRALWEHSGFGGLLKGDSISLSYVSLADTDAAWRLAAALWRDTDLKVLDLSFSNLSAASLRILVPALATMRAVEHFAMHGNPAVRDEELSRALADAVATLPSLRTTLLPEGGAELRRAFEHLRLRKRICVNHVYG
eukprot:TRINITY_DN10002_c0_g1_i1.p2 TRINITY_DN10002_c0_g1~~TRINITY_DN10002_c0_g1_i1.p2  ORF type:complete len:331 (+),score=77.90 TRINITY_DN10002_c0_g1_i1:77-994(+)